MSKTTWAKGIWATSDLPMPEYELDTTDPDHVYATGKYRLVSWDGSVPCSVVEYSEAMAAVNDSLTGNHRQKARYVK